MSKRTSLDRDCLGCGKKTQAKSRVCRACRPRSTDPEAHIRLPEGRWVPNGRGVVVFRKADDGLPIDREDAA